MNIEDWKQSNQFVVLRVPQRGKIPEVLEKVDVNGRWWSSSPNHPMLFDSVADAEALGKQEFPIAPTFDVLVLPCAEVRLGRLAGSNVFLPIRQTKHTERL